MENLCMRDVVNIDLNKGLSRTYAGMVLATGDNMANCFGAALYRGGEPVDITGYSVMGYFIRKGGADTVVIVGKAEGNEAIVELPQACYASDGSFSLAIKVSGADVTATVRVVDGAIRLTQTGTMIDPGDVVPSLDELFAKIEEMEAVTEEAQVAADTANQAAASVEGFKKEIRDDLAALTEENADVKKDLNRLQNDMGIICAGKFGNGEKLFTSSDVNDGDVIQYSFVAPETDVGYLRYYDASGNRIAIFGKTSGADTELHYSGEGVIPEGFAYCDVYATSDNKVNVEYVKYKYIPQRVEILETKVANLENNQEAERNALYEHSRNIFDTQFVNGRVNVTTGDLYIPSTISGYAVTAEMLAVEPDTEYAVSYVQGEAGGVWSVWEYGADKAFITKSANTRDNPFTFRTGENTHYVVLQIADSAYTADQLIPTFAQVEHGGKATMHVPHEVIDSELVDIKALYDSLVKNGVVPGDFVVPSYYHENQYLDNKVDRINECMGSAVANGDAFIFITDEHWEDNAKQSPALINYLYNNCNINKLFSGGDVYTGNNTDWSPAMDFTLTLRHAFKGNIYHICGNHDLFKQMPTSRLAMMFDMFHDDYNGNPEKHYYYVDNKRAKIRYIVLNSYYESETDNAVNGFVADAEQQQWFVDSLNVEAGWGIIILNHHTWYNDPADPTVLLFDSRYREPFLNVIDNYSGDGEIICFIQGHTHIDKVLRTDSGIPVIITTSDNYKSIESPADVYPTDRTPATIREQAFDVFVVDRKNRQINIIRIGCPALNSTAADEYGEEVEERIVTY